MIEDGILDPGIEAGYATDAEIELFVPGGPRVARGRPAVVAALARSIPSPARISDWAPDEASLMFEVVASGDVAGRMRQYHRFRLADGLIERHWVYACAPDFGGDNYSGATVFRADGDVFVKRLSPRGDWMMRATNDAGREALLWLDGTLQSLPDGIECATIAVDRDGDDWLLTMRDLSDTLLPDEPSDAQWTSMLAGLRALHARFRGRPPSGLMSLRDRALMFSDAVSQRELGGVDLIPKLALHGWRELPSLLPDDVRPAVLALAAEPAPLVAALERGPLTMIHGDARPPNVAVEGGRLVAFDWALATRAPAEVEYAWLVDCCPCKAERLAMIRRTLGADIDDRQLALAFLLEFLISGGHLAQQCVTGDFAGGVNPWPETWHWWVERIREGLSVLEP